MSCRRVVHGWRRPPWRAADAPGPRAAVEAGRRDLAAVALAAPTTLPGPLTWIGPALQISVDEALTEVVAMSGRSTGPSRPAGAAACWGSPSPLAAHLH